MNRETQKLILVIDDDEAVRDAITDILHMGGWATIAAASGESGVLLYKSRQAEVVLVILDLSMPGMDGHQTLLQLRAINPDVVVLLSSGYAESEIRGRFEELGVIGFLLKPYNAAQLLNLVRQYAER